MKRFNKIKFLLFVISVLGLIFLVQCTGLIESNDLSNVNSDPADIQNVPTLAKQGGGGLDDVEKADLLYMREEEKLAHDIYEFLFNEWGMPIFERIGANEQAHMDAIKRMIDKHNMTDIDPVIIQPEPGKFVNAKIQALYDDLEEKGVLSETDALEVGVLVEEIDIEDLLHFLERVDNQDIISVYNNILDGSYSHLDAFNKLLP